MLCSYSHLPLGGSTTWSASPVPNSKALILQEHRSGEKTLCNKQTDKPSLNTAPVFQTYLINKYASWLSLDPNVALGRTQLAQIAAAGSWTWNEKAVHSSPILTSLLARAPISRYSSWHNITLTCTIWRPSLYAVQKFRLGAIHRTIRTPFAAEIAEKKRENTAPTCCM